MKNDILQLKEKLDSEEKFVEYFIQNNKFITFFKNDLISKSNLYELYKTKGDFDAIKYMENMFSEIVKKLSQYNIEYDEIRAIINPTFFISTTKLNENNIKLSYEIPYNPELVNSFYTSIKFNFILLNNGKIINDKHSTSYNSFISSFLENINSNEQYFCINYKIFVQKIFNYGYEIDIRSFEDLLEKQNEDDNPSISINFKREKELKKGLKLN